MADRTGHDVGPSHLSEPLGAAQPAPENSARSRLWAGLALTLLVLVVAGVSVVRTLADLSKSQAAPTPVAAGTARPARVAAKDGMVQVYVPEGNFLMGSTDTQVSQVEKDAGCNGCYFDEKPQHTVYLDAYWIDQTEVTNAMYAQCVQTGQCQPPSDKSSVTRASYYGNTQYDRYPVLYVSWNDATAYCAWAGRRLPTEAEWEKAARGAEGQIYPWGNQTPDSTLVNFNQNVKDTTEVGKYSNGASPYGALDLAGNVWEWVNDWYGETYYSSSPDKNPTGPTSGQYRGLRGGSWVSVTRGVRATDRFRYAPDYRDSYVGFRCARSP